MFRPAALAALFLISAGGSAAAPLELRGIPAGATVSGGARVAISWSEPFPGTEAELLLSLDGGESFPLRVTPESAPDLGSLAFRVPNLPASRAVLALRTGEAGDEETIGAVSAVFSIAADPGAPAEPVVRRAGELATREAALGEPASFPVGLGSDLPTVSALTDLLDPADTTGAPPDSIDDAPLGAVHLEPAPRLPRAGGFHPRISLPKRE